METSSPLRSFSLAAIAWRSGSMPEEGAYRVLFSTAALSSAYFTAFGVSKKGSPVWKACPAWPAARSSITLFRTWTISEKPTSSRRLANRIASAAMIALSPQHCYLLRHEVQISLPCGVRCLPGGCGDGAPAPTQHHCGCSRRGRRFHLPFSRSWSAKTSMSLNFDEDFLPVHPQHRDEADQNECDGIHQR